MAKDIKSNKKIRIVGYQSGKHDVSYCILENGVPIIHEELERLIRIKEPWGDGLKMYFERVGEEKKVDYFAFGNPYFAYTDGKWDSRCSSKEINDLRDEIIIRDNAEFHTIGHHKSHAANAFYSSNFDNALVFTLDGGGVEENGTSHALTVWGGKDNKLNPIDLIPITTLNVGSPWRLYTGEIFGLSSGYPKGNQSGTVMAMACVGDPDKYFKDFYDGFIIGGGGHNPKVWENCKKYKTIVESSEQDKFDVAASLQKATEVVIKNFMQTYIDKHNPTNICLSGGVSLNCLMTGKMIDWWPNIRFYADPIPYDGGLCLGASRYLWHHILNNPRIKWEDNTTSYLGPIYSKEEVLEALDEFKCNWVETTDDDVIDLICSQKIISVFGDGSESGRRALGNRSILADPRSESMKDIINEKVKHRQWFRPFAPSILREEVKNWFEHDINSPYMSFVLKFKESVRNKAKAVVHFDGSGRLQTVTEKDNKWYYNFIKKFKEKTDVPILLNTSFNDREPIVETPQDAIKCFDGTDIDYLYFYNYNILIKK
tara:strand:- start:43 stop:1668 length:1626 start_codon:yes stop_codon:yes gene_type:complete